MPYTKSPIFPTRIGGVSNNTTLRDAIISVYAHFGFTPYATGAVPGLANSTGVVFAIPFSGAARGTIYQRYGITTGSQINFINYAVPAGVGSMDIANSSSGPNFQAQSNQGVDLSRLESFVYGYYRPNEGIVIVYEDPGRSNPVIWSTFSPLGKFSDWNEDLFPHIMYRGWPNQPFSVDAANTLTHWGLYRGTDPNFYNPFALATSSSTNNTSILIRPWVTLDRNPLDQIDIHNAPLAYWTGGANYGYFGRLSEDFGICSSRNLSYGTRIIVSPTEEWEVLIADSSLAWVLRVV